MTSSSNGQARAARNSRARTEPTPAPANPLTCCTSLSGLPDTPTEWLVADRIALGRLTILEGPKGCGKSALLAAIAADATGGPRLGPGRRRKPGRCYWFPGEEDPARDCRPKTAAAGCPAGRVLCPGLDPQGRWSHRLSLPSDLPDLLSLLEAQPARLVVLDPWHSFLAGTVSLFDTQTMRGAMESLADVASRTGAAIVCVRNYRKDDSGSALAHGLGSVEIANVARTVLQVRPHPEREGEYALAVAAGNLSAAVATLTYRLVDRDGVPVIRWGDSLALSSESLAAQVLDAGGRDERADARRLLERACTPGRWVAAKDILAEAQACGICPRTLRTAKAEMRIVSRRMQTGSTAHWEWGQGTPPRV